MNRRSLALLAAAAVSFCAAWAGVSPADAATGDGPVIAVIGDYGSGHEPEAQVARLVAANSPAAIVTVGDNVYDAPDYARLVGSYYTPWITSRQFFPATGNHEYLEGIREYDRYFSWLPGRRYYAVTKGDITFFVLDSQAALTSAKSRARQKAWLKAALAASTSRWKVVVLHHPPYSSGAVHGSSTQFRWPFATWGADLVLAGHDHEYERLREGGLTYIVDGSGGKDLYAVGKPISGSQKTYTAGYGALFLQSTPAGLVGRFLNTDGKEIDRFTIAG